MGKKNRTLKLTNPAELEILKQFVKAQGFKPCPKIKNEKELVTCQRAIAGEQALLHPELYGDKDHTGEPYKKKKTYYRSGYVYIDPFEWFRKFIEIHGFEDKYILNRGQKEWLEMYDKAQTILQNINYARSQDTNNEKETANQP